MKKASWFACGLLGLGALSMGACNSSDDGGGGSGGSGTGGATGGKSSGGSSTGGKSSGGSSTGGGATGGAASGGAATGGAPVCELGGQGGMGGLGGDNMGGSNHHGLVPTPHGNCEDINVDELEGDLDTVDGFEVSSPEFGYCESIPRHSTCDGGVFATGKSPALTWAGKPGGTKSFALVFKDISILSDKDPATERLGQHWVMWDIPGDSTGLPAGLSADHVQARGARQWAPRNQYGFFGPCPNPFPAGDARFSCSLTLDSYAFVLYALDVESIDVADLPDMQTDVANYVVTMDAYLRANALAYAEYRGTSDAWSTNFPPPPMDNKYPCTDTVTTDCLAGP